MGPLHHRAARVTHGNVAPTGGGVKGNQRESREPRVVSRESSNKSRMAAGGQESRGAEEQRGKGEGEKRANEAAAGRDSALVAVWNCIPSDGNGGMQNTARGTSEEGPWEVELLRSRNVYEARAVSFPRCWRPASANSKRDRAALARRSAPPGRKYTSPHRPQTQAWIPASRMRTPSLSNS